MTLLVSFLGGWLIPLIARESGIGDAFAIGALSCILSLVVASMLICLDKTAEKHDKELWKKRRATIRLRGDSLDTPTEAEYEAE